VFQTLTSFAVFIFDTLGFTGFPASTVAGLSLSVKGNKAIIAGSSLIVVVFVAFESHLLHTNTVTFSKFVFFDADFGLFVAAFVTGLPAVFGASAFVLETGQTILTFVIGAFLVLAGAVVFGTLTFDTFVVFAEFVSFAFVMAVAFDFTGASSADHLFFFAIFELIFACTVFVFGTTGFAGLGGDITDVAIGTVGSFETFDTNAFVFVADFFLFL
jgi:hypothetical protein